jgi:putative FmdB family regulatory protein
MQYDYRCPDCNSELTIERSIHEDPRDPSCFDCHITMVRKWASPAITFKGKGFYSTGGVKQKSHRFPLPMALYCAKEKG